MKAQTKFKKEKILSSLNVRMSESTRNKLSEVASRAGMTPTDLARMGIDIILRKKSININLQG